MHDVRNTPEYKARVQTMRAVHVTDTMAGKYILELAQSLSLLVIPLAFGALSLLLVL